MHDLFLGVCKYNFSKILHYFVYEKKFFCLETLNYRKQMFQYGDTEIGNISPPIQKHHIQNASFKMNARQMKTFSHLILLMVGDLIDRDDLVNKFLILFVRLIDLLLLSNYNDTILNDLQLLIEEHNFTYQKLFKEHLKPKFHNLVHYPTIIKKLGPIKLLWTFRFEAEHQLYKQYAQSITSRTNVPLTLAIKSSLRFANCVLKNNFFQPEYSFTNIEEIKMGCNEHLSSINLNFSLYKRTNEIMFRGVKFKIGHIVTVTINENINIYEVLDFIIKENNVEIVGKKWTHLNFSERFQSYLMGPVIEIYDVINLTTLDGPPIHFYLLNNGLKVLRQKKYW
ncbi:uncharacterized protein LOC125779384 [Bactrocera dorsalis]|uniref:Uncharacterized protein LOC125779384 n=1 Tax=Bactrocera dorsalis TaxID=27457 RepID=A0ABM3K5C0_BACDO|nr:uncharacterized protein LOC125779384 [Bactrocera dorsalis]